jgi:hypothetical protein
MSIMPTGTMRKNKHVLQDLIDKHAASAAKSLSRPMRISAEDEAMGGSAVPATPPPQHAPRGPAPAPPVAPSVPLPPGFAPPPPLVPNMGMPAVPPPPVPRGPAPAVPSVVVAGRPPPPSQPPPDLDGAAGDDAGGAESSGATPKTSRRSAFLGAASDTRNNLPVNLSSGRQAQPTDRPAPMVLCMSNNLFGGWGDGEDARRRRRVTMSGGGD